MELIAVYGIPGTGKTTFLLNTYKKMIKNDPIKSRGIYYWTFRKNMAEDFITRLNSKFSVNASTIHSICFRLLAKEFGYTRKDVALPWIDFVKFCRGKRIPISEDDLIVDDEDYGEDKETVGGKIYTVYTNCINTLTPFDKWDTLPDYMKPEFDYLPLQYKDKHECVVDVIDGWLRYLEKKNKIDFAQMLWKAYELKLKPDITIAMSDESHDMTPVQVKLTKMWSKDVEKLYVAYDTNQAIYSFWGTNTEFCEEVWKKANKRIVLTPSHRISKIVYNTARNILRMSGQDSPNVECIGKTKLWFCPPEKFIDAVKLLKPTILARTRYQLKKIAQILREHDLIFKGVYGWSDRMLSTYKVVWELRYGKKEVSGKEFSVFMDSYPQEFFKIPKHRLKSVMPSKLKIENVKNLITPFFAGILFKRSDPFSYVNKSAFTKRAIDMMNNALKQKIEPVSYAELHTIHGSKGLEWDYVLVVDGITPKIKRSIEQYRSEFENECRVWYVAFTRARKMLGVVDYSIIDRNIPFIVDRARYF